MIILSTYYVDLENYENFKSFGFIYIYIYIHIYYKTFIITFYQTYLKFLQNQISKNIGRKKVGEKPISMI